VVRAKTDSTGTAIATYTPGNASPGISIQDAVTASVTDATGTYSAGAVIITVRAPAAAGTGNRIDISGATTGGIGIITATVTRDDGFNPVANETVSFSFILNAGGATIRDVSGNTIPPLTVRTDNNGEAYVIFTSPPATVPPTPGYAAVRATITGGDAAVIITW